MNEFLVRFVSRLSCLTPAVASKNRQLNRYCLKNRYSLKEALWSLMAPLLKDDLVS